MNRSYADAPPILKEFLLYMETIKNLSGRTIDGYYIDLRIFFRFLKIRRNLCDVPASTEAFDQIDISDVDISLIKTVTTLDIYEYLHFVSKDRDNNSNTRARKVSSLRSYFKYLTLKVRKLEDDPAKDIEVPSIRRGLPRFLTLEESLSLLSAVSGDFYERDYCIVTMFLNCGMRLSELVGIDDHDIRDDTIRIVGKGNKERIVYLNHACLDAIQKYKNFRDTQDYPPTRDQKALFLSRRGTRLSARRVEQIVAENLALSGLDNRGYSPHKLRHTAATLMYRHGNVDMLALKEILGHEHVSTTEIYTHISDEQLKTAAKASPLSSVTQKKKTNE